MTFKEIITIILKKKWFVFWLTIFGAALFFDLTIIQAPQYRSDSKVLIIQNQIAGQDIYSISKSAQYISKILKESIYSDDFFEKILFSSDQIDQSIFNDNLKKRRKEWSKNVKIFIDRDLGMLKISVFNKDKNRAEEINQALTKTLVENHKAYHGIGDNIRLNVLDKTLTEKQPSLISLWSKTILGAFIGFISSLAFILYKKKKVFYLEKNIF